MSNNKHLWIFAGEESGDIYGGMLAKELYNEDSSLKLSGMGGRYMKEAKVDIIIDSSELGVMGFIEVLKHYSQFKKIFKFLKTKAIKEKPNAIIMIDYPGFNLRFAKDIFIYKIPVIWYISPQVWAWKKNRIYKLAKYCKKLFVLFPFEVDIYQNTALDVSFIGHPLVEIVNKRKIANIKRDENLILLLPGSRINEINKLLPEMLKTTAILKKENPQFKFVLCSPRDKIFKKVKEIYKYEKSINEDIPKIEVINGNTGEWMQKASAGLATSGTVTVECAIAGLPLVVAYKANPITIFLAKFLVKIKFFTMMNIVMNKEIFKEFLQNEVKANILAQELIKVLPNGNRRNSVIQNMSDFVKIISGQNSSPTKQIAKEICSIL